jgi:hypothetical protein
MSPRDGVRVATVCLAASAASSAFRADEMTLEVPERWYQA